jgi:hypothetical protein
MKCFFLLAVVCLFTAGCANQGGGWVVGNGMIDQGEAQRAKTFRCDCSEPGQAKDCGCQPGQAQKPVR